MIGGRGRVSGGGRGWKIWERLENLGEVGKSGRGWYIGFRENSLLFAVNKTCFFVFVFFPN